MAAAETLRRRLARKPILLAPGVYDALTALVATQAGAEALYLSGAAMAYTRLGRSDVGLMTMSEVADTIRLVRDRVATPLIVDADNGHGNALNVQRTVRFYEQAGASALQIEDQAFPKRCGHLAEKKLIPAAEMAGKIKAALDARSSDATLIIARTDAIAVEGFEAALERAEAYRAAGADMIFVEAPASVAELQAVAARFGETAPLMANMIEGGRTPLADTAALEAMGYSLVIYPGAIARALAHAMQGFYATLLRDGSTRALAGQMLDFDALNAVIGTPELLALGKRFEGEPA
jgi:2-methylisocitrate lyase-like PEP mutase family enzyme